MSDDRCPGVLRPHQAADGAMVRVRIPGGQTTGTALRLLGEAAERYGSGVLQLTSRGSVQVRGLPTELPTGFELALVDAGFLPSTSHERVRNVVASPLTGLVGGRADLRPMVAELDRALVAEPALATLSGRFLFGLDDGRDDVTTLAPDLAYRAESATAGVLLVGTDRGLDVAADEAVAQLVDLARRFAAAAAATGAWRLRDLAGWAEAVPGTRPMVPVDPAPLPLGAVGAHLSVRVPLGFLAPDQRRAVTDVVGRGAVVVTPWRGLVMAQAAEALPSLSAVGLVSDPASPWTALTACVGAPWCAKGRVDTQALVRSVAEVGATWPRTHVSGCERRCGAPLTPHRDLVAPSRDELLAGVLACA